MPKYIDVYLDTDTTGEDLVDAVGNPIEAGWYRYEWPLQGNDKDPIKLTTEECLASGLI